MFSNRFKFAASLFLSVVSATSVFSSRELRITDADCENAYFANAANFLNPRGEVRLPSARAARLALADRGIREHLQVDHYGGYKTAQGGFGKVWFTDNYAVKASIEGADELRKLATVARELAAGRLGHFNVCLPEAMYSIGGYRLQHSTTNSNMQVYQRVVGIAPNGRELGMADIVDLAFNGDPAAIEDYADFAAAMGSMHSENARLSGYRGVLGNVHSDLNPRNVVITRRHDAAGDATFTLIDLAEFQRGGHIESDVIYWMMRAWVFANTNRNFERMADANKAPLVSNITTRFFESYLGQFRNIELVRALRNLFTTERGVGDALAYVHFGTGVTASAFMAIPGYARAAEAVFASIEVPRALAGGAGAAGAGAAGAAAVAPVVPAYAFDRAAVLGGRDRAARIAADSIRMVRADGAGPAGPAGLAAAPVVPLRAAAPVVPLRAAAAPAVPLRAAAAPAVPLRAAAAPAVPARAIQIDREIATTNAEIERIKAIPAVIAHFENPANGRLMVMAKQHLEELKVAEDRLRNFEAEKARLR